MILSSVELTNHAAHARPIGAQDDEEVFNDKPHAREFIDDFDMSESLPVGADLILTFDDVDTFGF